MTRYRPGKRERAANPLPWIERQARGHQDRDRAFNGPSAGSPGGPRDWEWNEARPISGKRRRK